MLIVFGGLPGCGKTTLSIGVANRITAAYLRIDAIEQAIREGVQVPDVGATAYGVAQSIAEANLALRLSVIADCVNPVAASRRAWRDLAARSDVRLIEIEVICSDRLEHRRRVEMRAADIPGHRLPSWASVQAHVYEPWEDPHMVVDTAILTADDAINLIVASAAQSS